VIYFVTCPAANLLKVGFSADVEKRMRTLRYAVPVDLILLGTMNGDRALEMRIQTFLFDHHHHGEWFALNEVVVGHVTALLSGDFDLRRLPEKGVRPWALAWKLSDSPIAPNGRPKRKAA
jgi:hypothetical protein